MVEGGNWKCPIGFLNDNQGVTGLQKVTTYDEGHFQISEKLAKKIAAIIITSSCYIMSTLTPGDVMDEFPPLFSTLCHFI